jgi:hypothetical protein
MTSDDDTAAPEGYARPVTRRMTKAPPPDDVDAVAADTLERTAAAAAPLPAAAPAHGRPKGAGNAVAFHEWKKPPKPGSGG